MNQSILSRTQSVANTISTTILLRTCHSRFDAWYLFVVVVVTESNVFIFFRCSCCLFVYFVRVSFFFQFLLPDLRKGFLLLARSKRLEAIFSLGLSFFELAGAKINLTSLFSLLLNFQYHVIVHETLNKIWFTSSMMALEKW